MGSESHYYDNRPLLQGGNSGEWNGMNPREITNPFKRRTGLGAGKRNTQQTQARSYQPTKHPREQGEAVKTTSTLTCPPSETESTPHANIDNLKFALS